SMPEIDVKFPSLCSHLNECNKSKLTNTKVTNSRNFTEIDGSYSESHRSRSRVRQAVNLEDAISSKDKLRVRLCNLINGNDSSSRKEMRVRSHSCTSRDNKPLSNEIENQVKSSYNSKSKARNQVDNTKDINNQCDENIDLYVANTQPIESSNILKSISNKICSVLPSNPWRKLRSKKISENDEHDIQLLHRDKPIILQKNYYISGDDNLSRKEMRVRSHSCTSKDINSLSNQLENQVKFSYNSKSKAENEVINDKDNENMHKNESFSRSEASLYKEVQLPRRVLSVSLKSVDNTDEFFSSHTLGKINGSLMPKKSILTSSKRKLVYKGGNDSECESSTSKDKPTRTVTFQNLENVKDQCDDDIDLLLVNKQSINSYDSVISSTEKACSNFPSNHWRKLHSMKSSENDEHDIPLFQRGITVTSQNNNFFSPNESSIITSCNSIVTSVTIDEEKKERNINESDFVYKDRDSFTCNLGDGLSYNPSTFLTESINESDVVDEPDSFSCDLGEGLSYKPSTFLTENINESNVVKDQYSFTCDLGEGRLYNPNNFLAENNKFSKSHMCSNEAESKKYSLSPSLYTPEIPDDCNE
ncbi:unnamed protein product, partial [Meganyctiphanes norvegica]